MNPGGKGANQAVAVSRLGGDVVFITKVGNDLFGQQFSALFKTEGIDTSFLLVDDAAPSGVALITVDDAGENSIVVASGANARLLPADLNPALAQIARAGILLLQLETPLSTVDYVIDYAHGQGVQVILNPAPAAILSNDLLQKIDILTPNRSEASAIAGIPVTDLATALEAARLICSKGVKNTVVTMGALGAAVCEEGNTYTVPARAVTPLDSTAAGDVFNGALAVALSEGQTLREAVAFAAAAAAISVTRLGAQSSIPHRSEVVTD